MKGFKTLTLKRIRKRREKHPEDKKLHEIIDNTEINNNSFDFLVREATKQAPFDKKSKKTQ